MLRDDVNGLLNSVNQMTGNESARLTKANLDLLREAWSVFKNKFYEAKYKNLYILSFDMNIMQLSYANARQQKQNEKKR